MSYPEGPPAAKRMRDNAGAIVAVSSPWTGTAKEQQPPQQPQQHRTSSLPTPTLQLTGHGGSVYALKYSPSGAILCSTSFDMQCFLWSHANEDEFDETITSYSNFNVLTGHKNAVLDCAWLNDETVVTCGADKTVVLWDVLTGQRRRRYADQHSKIVNAVDCSMTAAGQHHTIMSVSDDGNCLVYDDREKRPVMTLASPYPILAVAAGPTDSHQVFLAGIDPKVYCWDIRRSEHAVYGMKGHTDTVTSLALHPDGTHVLSNSMDKTLRTWDIRPYVVGNKRHTATYTGHVHGTDRGLLKCAWSADGNLVSAGSSDHRVHIWDVMTQQELYDLPGHTGCVNAVTFHPKETTVVASGSSDRQIFVGELS
jgi:Prp8 binding protein